MKTLLRIGLTMLMLAVVLTGVSFGVLRAQVVGDSDYRHGDRTMASETRKVGDGIVAIDMNGSVDLILKQGTTPSMVVHAEQRMLSHIKTVQQGNTLRIDVEGMMFHYSRPQWVELTLPNLQQLESHGSGDSVINGFDGDKLALGMHGSGDVEFNGKYQHVNADVFGSGDLKLALGTASDVDFNLHGSGDVHTSGLSKSLTAHLLGSGELDAGNLPADAVKIDILGSGDATVHANQSIAADIKGSGDLEVHGNPTLRQVNKLGSGDISWDSN